MGGPWLMLSPLPRMVVASQSWPPVCETTPSIEPTTASKAKVASQRRLPPIARKWSPYGLRDAPGAPGRACRWTLAAKALATHAMARLMRAEVVVPGVPPDAAWAWWTDFRPGAEDHAFARWGHPERRVEEREDGSILVTDTGRLLGFRWLEVEEVTLAKPRLRFEARNNAGVFRGHYRFLPAAGGTRIEVVVDIVAMHRPYRWGGPLARAFVRWFVGWDLRHHGRDMQRDIGGGAGAASGGGAQT